MAIPEITVRRASEEDLEAIIEVASSALGWVPGEPHEQLFRWKHLDNAFGESPMWVAESGGRMAGFRAFMRWELVDATGRRWRAVRAVDTATHPDFQRMGVFSKLTMGALAEMEAEGVDIVFNTPNDQSRPGYLKMGWIEVGRLPVSFRPTSPAALVRIAKARTPANKWSEPSSTGVDARLALADPAVGALLQGRPAPMGLATPLDPAVVQWRYGLEPLHYRAWLGPDGDGSVADGVVVFRIRRRGPAVECAVGTTLAPGGDPDIARALITGLARHVDADYLIRIGVPDRRAGFAPLPGQGPRLTARKVTSDPPPDIGTWQFTLGDVELF